MLNIFRREPKSATVSPGTSAGPIEIRQPWARSESRTSLEGGGFFTLTNTGTAPDRLVAASSPQAEKVEIHAIKVVGAGVKMRPLEDGLAIRAASTVTLKPRGYHLLLVGLNPPLAEGTSVPVTLTFEKAGRIDVALAVAAPGPIGKEILVEADQPG